MIVVDTSALMAVILREPGHEDCAAVLKSEADVRISAATLAEALIVAGRRHLEPELAALVDQLGFTVEPLDERGCRRSAGAYARWGKGVHPAGLNLGDCFAYALAQEMGCPLLYVGSDFARTDIARAAPERSGPAGAPSPSA